MVRVGEDQGNTHPRALSCPFMERQTKALGILPNDSKHHYGAEPSFHRSASQRNAALVLVRAYVTPEHVQNRL